VEDVLNSIISRFTSLRTPIMVKEFLLVKSHNRHSTHVSIRVTRN